MEIGIKCSPLFDSFLNFCSFLFCNLSSDLPSLSFYLILIYHYCFFIQQHWRKSLIFISFSCDYGNNFCYNIDEFTRKRASFKAFTPSLPCYRYSFLMADCLWACRPYPSVWSRPQTKKESKCLCEQTFLALFPGIPAFCSLFVFCLLSRCLNLVVWFSSDPFVVPAFLIFAPVKILFDKVNCVFCLCSSHAKN